MKGTQRRPQNPHGPPPQPPPQPGPQRRPPLKQAVTDLSVLQSEAINFSRLANGLLYEENKLPYHSCEKDMDGLGFADV